MYKLTKINTKNNAATILFFVLGLAALIGVLALVGALIILCLNTLFPALAIPYSAATIASVVALLAFIRGSVTVSKS